MLEQDFWLPSEFTKPYNALVGRSTKEANRANLNIVERTMDITDEVIAKGHAVAEKIDSIDQRHKQRQI